MANLTQTPANVGIGDQRSRLDPVIAGEAITQGMPVYESAGKWYQADANVLSASQATAIAMSAAAADNDPLIVAKGAECLISPGATLTVGETYVVSRTKGAICPIGDLTTGDYPCILGIATTTKYFKTVYAYSNQPK